jgi:hypothetical protein
VSLDSVSAAPADTLVRSIDIQTSGGDVLVRVPSGYAADLDLQTSSGTITVQGIERSQTVWSRPLNGGDANRPIRCVSGSGDITIIEVAAQP